jgi:beta-lactamase class A
MSVLASAQDSVVHLLERKLLSRLQALDSNVNGVIGVAIIDLTTGSMLHHNGNVVFPQASVIKIPILAEVFRRAEAGEIHWKTALILAPADSVGGSGELQKELAAGPVKISVEDLVSKMIRNSDNTATNKLIDMLGMDAINRWIANAGLKQTKLQRRMLDGAAAATDRENISTPLEMAYLAELLHKGKLVSSGASAQMIEIMKGVKADFRANIPAAIPVAAKPGDLTGVHAETGIVFLPKRPFALSVMSTFLDGKTNPVPQIMKLVFQHFEKLGNSNRYGHKLQ